MSNAGIPLRIIQEISGHSNLEQLQREERGEAGSSQRSNHLSFHAFLQGETAFPPVEDELSAVPLPREQRFGAPSDATEEIPDL